MVSSLDFRSSGRTSSSILSTSKGNPRLLCFKTNDRRVLPHVQSATGKRPHAGDIVHRAALSSRDCGTMMYRYARGTNRTKTLAPRTHFRRSCTARSATRTPVDTPRGTVDDNEARCGAQFERLPVAAGHTVPRRAFFHE